MRRGWWELKVSLGNLAWLHAHNTPANRLAGYLPEHFVGKFGVEIEALCTYGRFTLIHKNFKT